jgi:hypothetical protein
VYEEERFIAVPGFRAHGQSWVVWAGERAGGSCLLHGDQEAKRDGKGQGASCPLEGPAPMTSLPPTGPTSLRFFHLPVAPWAGDQALNTQHFWGKLM